MSIQHLQGLLQTTAFKIFECNFIHCVKFCFLIQFNYMRQELSSYVYKIVGAPRNPDLFGTLDITITVLKKRKNVPIQLLYDMTHRSDQIQSCTHPYIHTHKLHYMHLSRIGAAVMKQSAEFNLLS